MRRPFALLLILGCAFAPGAQAHDSAAMLRARLDQAEARVVTAQARMLDAPVARAEVEITLAKMALDTAGMLAAMKEDPARIAEWEQKAQDSLSRALVDSLPSRSVEARGMFVDAGSLPKTAQGIRDLVDRLAQAHFNMILPEVIRRGYTLYPSAFTERDPEFAGLDVDPVGLLVTEAHRHGIEVHPWVWTFRVRSPGFGNPVLARLPALAARSERTTEPRFLSPADPESREYVYGLVDELTSRYDLDGLCLDYIRYDEETPDDWISQTRFSFDYRARHGHFPAMPVAPFSADWVEYQLWREEQVNQTVRALSQRLHARFPGFQLSVATFRGEKYARLNKMQDWRHWSDNAWADVVTSMLYTPRPQDLGTWLDWETDHGKRSNLLYAILGPLRMDDPVRETLLECEVLNQRQNPGVLLFSLGHMTPELWDALGQGPFRRPAMVPHRHVMLAVRHQLVEVDDDYLGPIQDGADFDLAATVAVLRTEIKKVARSLPLDQAPFWQNGALTDRLEGLKSLARQMVTTHHLPEPVADELAHRVDYAEALVRANAQHLAATRYVPATLPPGSPETNEARD